MDRRHRNDRTDATTSTAVREGATARTYRGRDGLDVRLAAPEREVPVQRERLSVVGVLLAFVASGTGRGDVIAASASGAG